MCITTPEELHIMAPYHFYAWVQQAYDKCPEKALPIAELLVRKEHTGMLHNMMNVCWAHELLTIVRHACAMQIDISTAYNELDL